MLVACSQALSCCNVKTPSSLVPDQSCIVGLMQQAQSGHTQSANTERKLEATAPRAHPPVQVNERHELPPPKDAGVGAQQQVQEPAVELQCLM